MRYLYLKDSNSLQPNHINHNNYCYYHIADSVYQTDTKLHELEYLLQAHVNDQSAKAHSSQPLLNKITYSKNTQIGENKYPLKVSCNNNSHYHIQVNADSYRLNSNSITVSASSIDITLLMGPAMLLNLALNNVFCLHASAFIIKNTLFILMAESGTGKSTIARYMNQQQHALRIADDIVPLKIQNKKLSLLSNFPQLKLSQQQQYTGNDICKKTIFLCAVKSKSETTIKPIDTFNSMKKLIQHSVATRLFAKNELNKHLKFCYESSLQTSAYHLKYQHSDNSLKQLTQLLYEII